VTDHSVELEALPKISLHDHLDGGVRPQTVLDLAEAADLPMPASDERGLADWFVRHASAGSLGDYLATFDVTVAVMQTRESLMRVAREYVNDLGDDGVIYGEVRWAPELHLTGGLTLDETVEAVRDGIELGSDDVCNRTGATIRVTQLLSAMRHANRSREIAQLALAHRDDGVVGFDLAGAEAGFPPSNHREAFDYAARHFVPVTVHAGEADGPDSVRSALFDGRALRLGHGVRVADDIEVVRDTGDASYVTLGPLAQWVRDRQIALELCPTSNLQTGAVARWGGQRADHPFDLMFRLGFAVTVNTDNRLMGNTTLSRELGLLSDTFGYDLDDLESFQLNAAEAAFLPRDDRDELVEVIRSGFEAAR
jgi:adenosine deaminase